MTPSPPVRDPVITTSRLSLRMPQITDAAFFLELLNDPLFVRFTGDRGIHDLAGAADYVSDRLLALHHHHGFTLYLVEQRHDQSPVGICGFVQRDYLDAPDIGFGYLTNYHGQGIGYEAASACLAYGRDQLGLKRIYGITRPDNRPSIGLLTKLGLRLDHTNELPNIPGDSHVFVSDLSLPHTPGDLKLADSIPPPILIVSDFAAP
jgi:RimJ/RimL family protein N-acetyltransferase